MSAQNQKSFDSRWTSHPMFTCTHQHYVDSTVIVQYWNFLHIWPVMAEPEGGVAEGEAWHVRQRQQPLPQFQCCRAESSQSHTCQLERNVFSIPMGQRSTRLKMLILHQQVLQAIENQLSQTRRQINQKTQTAHFSNYIFIFLNRLLRK